eukprot:SAG22_NODE_2507_length_2500_cov_1.565181_3_plen_183_part_00
MVRGSRAVIERLPKDRPDRLAAYVGRFHPCTRSGLQIWSICVLCCATLLTCDLNLRRTALTFALPFDAVAPPKSRRKDFPNCFRLQTEDRKFILACETPEEKTEWEAMFQKIKRAAPDEAKRKALYDATVEEVCAVAIALCSPILQRSCPALHARRSDGSHTGNTFAHGSLDLNGPAISQLG